MACHKSDNQLKMVVAYDKKQNISVKLNQTVTTLNERFSFPDGVKSAEELSKSIQKYVNESGFRTSVIIVSLVEVQVFYDMGTYTGNML